jgi:hypothetical protein
MRRDRHFIKTRRVVNRLNGLMKRAVTAARLSRSGQTQKQKTCIMAAAIVLQAQRQACRLAHHYASQVLIV